MLFVGLGLVWFVLAGDLVVWCVLFVIGWLSVEFGFGGGMVWIWVSWVSLLVILLVYM